MHKNFRKPISKITNTIENQEQHHRHHHHHYHLALTARVSLAFSRHPSQPPIAPGRSSRLHPVSAQSCCKQILAGRPTFARPCEGVHWNISLLSSSSNPQQRPPCLVCLTFIVFLVRSRWLYSCYFVGYCLQACSILV